MKQPKIILPLLLVLCTAGVLQASSEENIKAAYLERFAMFIECPNPIPEYNVCVYNDDAFGNTLEKMYASRRFNNRPVKVLSLSLEPPSKISQPVLFSIIEVPSLYKTVLSSINFIMKTF